MKKMLEQRAKKAGAVTAKGDVGDRTEGKVTTSDRVMGGSQESADHPVLGLPPQSIDEAVKEIREEIREEMEARQRKGIASTQTL